MSVLTPKFTDLVRRGLKLKKKHKDVMLPKQILKLHTTPSDTECTAMPHYIWPVHADTSILSFSKQPVLKLKLVRTKFGG